MEWNQPDVCAVCSVMYCVDGINRKKKVPYSIFCTRVLSSVTKNILTIEYRVSEKYIITPEYHNRALNYDPVFLPVIRRHYVASVLARSQISNSYL